MNHWQTITAQLIAELETQLRPVEEKARRLRSQIEAAKTLASRLDGEEDIAIAKSEPRPVLLRAKNTAGLVVMFLRDQCPGATVPELHAKMVEAGISVGLPEYLYTVVKKLERQGLARRDPNSPPRGGRYYAVTPETNLVLQAHREGVTQ